MESTGNGSGVTSPQNQLATNNEPTTENANNPGIENANNPGTQNANPITQNANDPRNHNGNGPAAGNGSDVVIDGDDEGEGRKRKTTSYVWDHFKRIKIGDIWKAVCQDCGGKLSGNSKYGTSHLREHLKTCRMRKQKNIKQALLNPTKATDGSVKLGTYSYDHEHARRELGNNMIILHEYPLSMVEHIGFRRYSHALQPLFKVVSRNTIKSDIFKIFEFAKEKTMKLLDSNESRIAITTDMWTSSNQKRGFMAVTSHFIDDSWKLQSRLVRFVYVPCPHTAEVLADALIDCLLEWNLDRKLSTLTVDNCTSNDKMVDIILEKIPSSALMLDGGMFHMRCCAHILNLVVKDGLNVIKDSVEIIRSSVAHWTATPKREEKFVEAARQLKIGSTKKLELDCVTRWNSTYNMLNTALIYKDVFTRLKQRDPVYKRVPSEKDWSKTMVIAEKLAIFHEVTELFSNTKYPTANLYFTNLCEIRLSIYDWVNSDDLDVSLMAMEMVPKFEKYWDVMHGLMAIASVLDPRFKMRTIEFYFPLIYHENSGKQVENTKLLLHDLVKEYQSKSAPSQEFSQASSSSSSSRPPLPRRSNYADQFESFMSTSASTSLVKSELDHYLEESLLPRNGEFDILLWWRSNGVKYPTLHSIAKDVLAIPVSTVASESTFSTSGRVVSAHRSRLHSKTVEALMCARDWLWSEIQDEHDVAELNEMDEEYSADAENITLLD